MSEPPDPEYDQSTGVYRAEYRRDRNGALSVFVGQLVAMVADEDPMSIPPLNDAIDPDALDSLFAPRQTGGQRTAGHLEFTYAGYRVTVHADNYVTVEPPGDPDGE